jgi:hypothetical protein
VPLAFALFGAVILFYNLLQIGRNLFASLWTIASKYGLYIPLYVIIVLILIYISIAAFNLRGRNRVAYGLIEILFGLILILYTVSDVVVDPYLSGKVSSIASGVGSTLILQLLAGMYIIVRGLSNIEDGLEKGKLTVLDMLTVGAFWSGNFLRSRGILNGKG